MQKNPHRHWKVVRAVQKREGRRGGAGGGAKGEEGPIFHREVQWDFSEAVTLSRGMKK